MASRKSEEILKKEFKITIADEAHYLKNRTSKRSK